MNGSEHNRPFWRRKANKVVTYDVTGQQNDLYMTNKRGSNAQGRRYSRGENVDPSFRSFEKTGNLQAEEGYLLQKGNSPARKVTIMRPEMDDSDRFEYGQQEFTLTRTMPLQQTTLFSNQILNDSIEAINIQPKRRNSPIKKEVASKFVGVLEDLGNYDFNPEDIRTQEEMMDKLQFVQTSIKKLKHNIRDYSSKPYTAGFSQTATGPINSKNPVSFRLDATQINMERDKLNTNLFQENESLKKTLQTTENQEQELTQKFENVMRSPVKEADHAKIQILITENEMLMQKAEEYVSSHTVLLKSKSNLFREHSIQTIAKSCRVQSTKSNSRNQSSVRISNSSNTKYLKIKTLWTSRIKGGWNVR